MNKQTAIGIGIVVVLAAGALYYFFKPTGPVAPPPTDLSFKIPTSVVVAQSVVGGKYTFSGTVPIGSGCDELTSGISGGLMGSTTIGVAIDLRVLQPGGVNCDSIPTSDQPFSASFTPANPSMNVVLSSLKVNGQPIKFTIATSTQ